MIYTTLQFAIYLAARKIAAILTMTLGGIHRQE